MNGVKCKVIPTIVCILIGFLIIENFVLILINYHLHNGVKLKSTADVFLKAISWDAVELRGNYVKAPIAVQQTSIEVEVNGLVVVGERTREVSKSNESRSTLSYTHGGRTELEPPAHHSRNLSGVVFDNHTFFHPLPPCLNDSKNSNISLNTNFPPFPDLLTNRDYNIFTILKRWNYLSLPFLNKATPALHLSLPSAILIPSYCWRYRNKSVECLKLKSRGLSPWELNGNHIMFTLRTTTSLHASRLPLLFQTWMTAINRSNIFIVTDGQDKVLEYRAREAGTSAVAMVIIYHLLPW